MMTEPPPAPAAASRSSLAVSDRARFWLFALGALTLYLVSPLTEWGDSLHYALVIERGSPAQIFESAHLLWRPVGWLLWHIHRLWDPSARSFEPLKLFSILAAALGVGAAAVWLRRRLGEGLPATLGGVVFAVGYAYWSYATTSCSYTASTAASLGALVLVWPEERRAGLLRTRTMLAAAALQSLAVALWLPGLLTTPAVALAAGLEQHPGGGIRFRAGRFLGCGFAVAGLLLVVYGVSWALFVRPYAAAALGPGAGVGTWLSSGQHGHPYTLSLLELVHAAYGWTRLVWQPWRLAPDPDAQGLGALFTGRVLWEWGVWKPMAVHVLAAIALWAGFTAAHRREWATWSVLAAWILPHAGFALGFKGTDPERWLPVWGAVLATGLLWAVGSSPGPARRFGAALALGLIALVGAVDRFGPHGNVENRPQMQLLRAAAPYVRPGDMIFLGGEMDESQLNRTFQTYWGMPWVYFTGAAAIDVWTFPLNRFFYTDMKYEPRPTRPPRTYVSESVLAGIPPHATRVEGADDRRDRIMRRMDPGPLHVAFVADDIRFFELLPDTTLNPALAAFRR